MNVLIRLLSILKLSEYGFETGTEIPSDNEENNEDSDYSDNTNESTDDTSDIAFEQSVNFIDNETNIIKINAKDHKVEAVVVYLSHAEVSKTINSIELLPGPNKIVIEYLPPVIIHDIFRIIVPPDIPILDTQIKVVPLDILKNPSGDNTIDLYEEESTVGLKLHERLRQAEISLVMLERKQKMLDATFIPSSETGGEKSFAGNPAFVLTAMREENATEDFERILQYYADKSAELEKLINEQNKKIARLRHMVKEFEGVNNARWDPIYDIRVEKNVNQMNVFYGGDIYQSTGEPWTNAEISLVTSKGLLDQYRFPKIDRKTVIAIPNEQYDYSLISEKAKVGEKAFASEKRDQDSQTPFKTIETSIHQDVVLEIPDYKKIDIHRDSKKTGYDEGSNQTFSVGEAYTILPNNRPHRVEVSFIEFDSSLMFTAFPQALGTIFLRVVAKNVSVITFIPGQFQVYVNNSYVATGTLPLVKPGGFFDINLGPDQSIAMANPEPNINKFTSWSSSQIIRKEIAFPLIFKNLSSTSATLTIHYCEPRINDNCLSINSSMYSVVDSGFVGKMLGISNSKTIIEKSEDRSHIDGVCKWIINIDPDEQKMTTLCISIKYPSNLKLVRI
ncbi:hypothetical protein BB559_007175 [Furculomyces boomerangus]|uniref:DUF4139 domain-containing protein n=1 Tax=Furculomyces boomerangus TaxID=61424 RepID=A0A2T9XYK1_9FUNG|nr:hypothetical protein BB559_007175 [Furculomyces boomerangus]